MSDEFKLELTEETFKLLQDVGTVVKVALDQQTLLITATFAAAGIKNAKLQRLELVEGKPVLFYIISTS